MLAVQTLFCALYASLVMFRALKRDYEASIMSAAFCGFALARRRPPSPTCRR